MESISKATRDKVASDAHHRCEYCQTAQEISGAQMHIEHIIPLSRGGRSDAGNLCLACAWCNSYKWAQTSGLDPVAHEDVPLFHPRTQSWHEHFRWDAYHITGVTAIGRATVDALSFNHDRRLKIRQAEALFDLFPPHDDE